MFKSTKLACVFVLCLAAVLVLASCGQDSSGSKTFYIPSDALTAPTFEIRGYANIFFASTDNNIVQYVYEEALLDGLPDGAKIIGMRLQPYSASSGFPEWADDTVSQFEVRLSTSENEPDSLSNTFSENRGADEVFVIPETSWNIVADDYHNDECQALIAAEVTPCAFGPFIRFANPFVYAGGSILMEVASVGFTNATPNTLQAFTPGGDVYTVFEATSFDDARIGTLQDTNLPYIAFVYTD